MPVDVFTHTGDEGPADLRADAERLLEAVGHADHEWSVLLCDDATIRGLNLTWRGKDQPTDVLSFPQIDAAHATPGGATPTLGDVVISVDTAARQAEEVGHDLADELRVLLAHGLLHLLGHDHEEDTERWAMEAEERRLLAVLDVDRDGLVGRSEPPDLGYRIDVAVGPLPAAWRAGVAELYELCFASTAEPLFAQTELGAPALSVVAFAEDAIVGFKVGSERRAGEFHSAAGGVRPDWRRRGVARALARRQQLWCNEQGYSAITTHTRADRVAMQILNLTEGFQIVGVDASSDAPPKVMFRKQLAPR